MKKNIKFYTLFLSFLLPVASFAQLGDLDLDSIDLSQFAPGGAQAEKKDTLGGISDKVTDLQDQIRSVTETFKKSSPNEKLKQLDNVSAEIQSALDELTEKGELGREIKKAITEAEATMKKYQSKAADPNVSPRQRARYERLADNFQDNMKGLYDQETIMYKAKKRMEAQLKIVEEDKEYIVDVIRDKDIKEALRALAEVTNKINSIADDFDTLTGDLVDEATGEEPEETGSN